MREEPVAREPRADAVGERLRELYPSCATDCDDGCKYGCLGWLHRFDPDRSERDEDHGQRDRSSLN